MSKSLKSILADFFSCFLTFQALEETKMNQVRIISELEKEKKKMQDDVLKLKEAKVNYCQVLLENLKILGHCPHSNTSILGISEPASK